MSNNLNFKQKIQMAWVDALPMTIPKTAMIGKILPVSAGIVGIGKNAIGGIAQTLSDSATSISAQDIASFECEFSTEERVVLHQFPKHKLENEVGLADIGTQLAAMSWKNVDRDFFSMLEGLLSASSPRAGTSVGCVGANKKYVDTGKKGLIGESGEFTYSNKLTGALSEDNLWAAITLLQKQRDDRGLQMDLAQGPTLVLVCSAKNSKAAGEIINSMLSGSDMAANQASKLFKGVCTWEFSDDDDWMLIDTAVTPLGYAMSREPTVEIRESADGLFVICVVKYHGVPVYSPYEFGLVGSDVA